MILGLFDWTGLLVDAARIIYLNNQDGQTNNSQHLIAQRLT